MGPSALAERLLHAGSLGHNHFWLYRDAMDAVLNDSDWDSVERYAAALEIYTSAEPLPRTTFFITKGRALAKFGRGTKGPCVSLMGLWQAPRRGAPAWRVKAQAGHS